MINIISKYKRSAMNVFLALVLVAAGSVGATNTANADQNPANCNSNDFSVNIARSTSVAYDETHPNGATIITYTASAGNPNTSTEGCDVTDVTIKITTPDGIDHVIQTGGNYPIGTPIGPLAPTVQYTANSANVAGGVLTATVNAIGTLHDSPNNNTLNISKAVGVTVIHPNTLVSITPSNTAVASGGTVNLTVTEQNTGDTVLSTTTVTVTPPGTTYSKSSPEYSSGDTNANSKLDPGETWTWLISNVAVASTTSFTVVGDGIDLLGNHVTFPTFPSERATTTVSIVDAKISILPDGTNEIGDKHTFTAHVDVDSGSGFVNAPDGTVIQFAAASGPGTFDAPSCITAGGTGSCTNGLTSPTPGVTVVNATTDVVVGGVNLNRTTNGSGGNSGPATKTWVDANIQISPLVDTNPVNHQHLLLAHVNVNTGTGGYVNAPDGTTIFFNIVSGPGNLANPSCITAGGTGSCSNTLTSAATGTTVVNASTTVVVGGVSLSRNTDGIGANSGNASKTWVQTKIITTASAAVPIGGQIHDTAILSDGVNPTGTITFNVYGPGDDTCATPLAPQPTGATVNGNGSYDSGNFTVTQAGTYRWIASYSGDSSNSPATGACNDANEAVVILPNQPTVTTDLSADTVAVNTPVHDSATLTGATANAGGTATYSVYSGNVCTGVPVFTNQQTVTNAIIPDSTDFTPTSAGTYNWQVVYSGDANNLAATSTCLTETLIVEQPQVPTRTQGFWQTHTATTQSVLAGAPLNGTITLGGMVINSPAKLFGGFYSNIAKMSTGGKRSAIDQARMQLAQQYIAATLNCAAFTCPASITTLLSQASSHFSTGTAAEILADAAALDAYNNSGDAIPSTLPQSSATPKTSSGLADKVFWDALN